MALRPTTVAQCGVTIDMTTIIHCPKQLRFHNTGVFAGRDFESKTELNYAYDTGSV
jgi:hypothetical protein